MRSSKGLVLITGGSRGIGAATARLCAADGYDVCVTYAHEAAPAAAVAEAARACGVRAQVVRADVGVEADVRRLFAEIDGYGGRLTGLVNNAGIIGARGTVAETSAAVLERVMAVNVIGTMLCAGEAVRRMSTDRGGAGGAIVNVSSVAATLGAAGEYVHYAASKAAVNTFTIGLAQEVAAQGIRVNAVSPGLIDTEIHARAGAPDRLARLAPGLPMGRAGEADEVARCIVWLLSAEASYVTAANLSVAGGR